jgi:hypothetical protein
MVEGVLSLGWRLVGGFAGALLLLHNVLVVYYLRRINRSLERRRPPRLAYKAMIEGAVVTQESTGNGKTKPREEEGTEEKNDSVD